MILTEGIVNEAIEERKRQDKKWGEQNHDPFTYLAILGEEVGEANQAALQAHEWLDGHKGDIWNLPKLNLFYRKELIQVAAVAIAMIECLDRGKWK